MSVSLENRPSLRNLAFELHLRIFQDLEPRDLLTLEEVNLS